MSRDICNHVLLRVHHLANRLVVLLESRVFSSLAKLLHLATRIKVEHKTNFSGILGFGRLFKWTNWSCGVWHSWQACHVGAFGKMNLSFPWQHQASTIRNSNEPSFTSSRTERTFPRTRRATLKTTRKRWSRSRYFQIEEEHSNGATKLSRSYACTLKRLNCV